jgi:pilus assembly protein CpaE
MLRGLVITTDNALSAELTGALEGSPEIAIVRVLDRQPAGADLARFIRAHAPDVVFSGVDQLSETAELIATLEEEAPGVQVIGISRHCDASLLLEVMRLGIREFLSLPFQTGAIHEMLLRVYETIEKRPASVHSTEEVYSFLPAKQGVGATTLAVHSAFAFGRLPDAAPLLLDFDLNSGIIGFLLRLENARSILDAAEASHRLDETNWPGLVTKVDGVDVLPAGRLNPELRIEAAQLRKLLDFAKRQYKVLCADLSGNLERYSIDVMRASKRIFLVCTPELPALHLAREKLNFLEHLGLAERVAVLINRNHKRAPISAAELGELLGVEPYHHFLNDYHAINRSVQAGRPLDGCSLFGKEVEEFVVRVSDRRQPERSARRALVEYFALVPARYAGLLDVRR